MAQPREGKAQVKSSQGPFASALRRSSKAGLESGAGQTTSSRAIPVTSSQLHLVQHLLEKLDPISKSQSHLGLPVFLALGPGWARPGWRAFHSVPLSTAVGPGEAERTVAPELQLGGGAAMSPFLDVLSRTGRREARLEPGLACQPPAACKL